MLKLKKESKPFYGFVFVGLLITMGIFYIGCSSKNNPTAPASNPPAGPTNTPTVTATRTPIPGVYWQSADVYRSNGSDYASVNLTVDGQSASTITVVVSGPSISSPVTLPYNGIVYTGGANYANYFINSSNLNYTPGSSVTLTTIAGSVTATSHAVLPGNITIAPDGSQTSWVISSGSVAVSVTGPATFAASGVLNSPYSIPASVYASGGNFTVTTTISNNTGTVTGAAVGSQFDVYDQLSANVILATATPTITLSPTVTPTITVTATPSPIPGIYWEEAQVYRLNNLGSVNLDAELILTVNGSPVSTVNAVVTGPGISTPVTLAYSAPVTINSAVYAGYYGSGIPYQPGQPVTLTTVSGAQTATGTQA